MPSSDSMAAPSLGDPCVDPRHCWHDPYQNLGGSPLVPISRALPGPLAPSIPPIPHTHTEEAIAPLYRRASNWCAANNVLEDAISHVVRAGAALEAAWLVEVRLHQALNREDVRRLERRMTTLPETILPRPRTLIAQDFIGLTVLGLTLPDISLLPVSRRMPNASAPRTRRADLGMCGPEAHCR